MKKKFRIAVILDITRIQNVAQILRLAFGNENVMESINPAELYGILKLLHPTTLIMDPKLFHNHGFSPEQLAAFKKDYRFKTIAIVSEKSLANDPDVFDRYCPDRTYTHPADLLNFVREIPTISTHKYTKRKAPLQNDTEARLDQIFHQCGFHCEAKGAKFLRDALMLLYFDPSLHETGGATKIYKLLAKKYETTPRIAERAMLRFLEISWSYETERRLRQILSVPEFYSFSPLNFRRFSEIFNTYYTIKYGDPEKILSRKKRESSNLP